MNRMQGGIGFLEDIIAIVDDNDRECMISVPRGNFDLHDYRDVRSRVNVISKHLRGIDGLP